MACLTANPRAQDPLPQLSYNTAVGTVEVATANAYAMICWTKGSTARTDIVKKAPSAARSLPDVSDAQPKPLWTFTLPAWWLARSRCRAALVLVHQISGNAQTAAPA